MTERRFFVPPDEIDDAGSTAFIRGAEHHHLQRVLRLAKGDALSVFDGRGRGFSAVVEELTGEVTRVRLVAPEVNAIEARIRITLVQALPSHDRMDLVIQKTTELGVERIVPIVARRCSVSPARAGTARLERWRRIAREAARQSGRVRVPRLDPPIAWSDFLQRDPGDGIRLLFDIAAPRQEGLEGLAPTAREAAGATLAIGPEGGWAPEERDMAHDRGYRIATLGPRTLRTETAAIVATGLLLFLAGEMSIPAGRPVP